MKFLYLFALIPFLISCLAEPHADLSKFVKDSQSADYLVNEKMPVLSTIKPLKFLMDYKRDPFVNNKEKDLKVNIDLNQALNLNNRVRESLELYPLNELFMCGTLLLDGTMWGMIKTKNGELFMVKTGSYIGLNHGIVSKVMSEEIDIIESILNHNKLWEKIPTKLFLNPNALNIKDPLSRINQ